MAFLRVKKKSIPEPNKTTDKIKLIRSGCVYCLILVAGTNTGYIVT